MPTNLPTHLTSFIGREQEIAEVKRQLGLSRRVTRTGTGGCGKTRPALEVAADLLAAFPGRIWPVELASVTDPTLVPQAVASVLGVREELGRPLLATLSDSLRPQRLLLVLDNCEHLVAACATLADSLLRACPDLRILATSREALGIAGETVWRVPSLTLPDLRPPPTPEELTRSEAARLLIDRPVAGQQACGATTQKAPGLAHI